MVDMESDDGDRTDHRNCENVSRGRYFASQNDDGLQRFESLRQLETLFESTLDRDDDRTAGRIRNRFVNTFFQAIGVYALLIPANIAILLLICSQSTNSKYYSTMCLAAIYVIVLSLNAFAARRYQRTLQLRANSALEELKSAGSRLPILYLRSFAIDDTPFQRHWSVYMSWLLPIHFLASTPEQRLVKVLARFSPVVAIGRPGEKIPPLGAARFYVGDDRWQDVISQVSRSSELVVLVTGDSAGLKWEIAHLLDNLTPRRLVLIPHPILLQMNHKEREDEWSRFVRNFGEMFPRPLPKRLDRILCIEFGEGFVPRPVTARNLPSSASLFGRPPLCASLDEVLQDRGMNRLPLIRKLTSEFIYQSVIFYLAVFAAWAVVLFITFILLAAIAYWRLTWYMHAINGLNTI